MFDIFNSSDDEEQTDEGTPEEDDDDVNVTYSHYTPEEIQDGVDEDWDVDVDAAPTVEGEMASRARLHEDFIAPSEIQPEEKMIQSGEAWIQNLYANEWPNEARPGFLNALFADSRFDTDISMHITPRDQNQAKRDLKHNMGDIRAEWQQAQEGDPARARDLESNLRDAEQMYDLVSQQGMTMFSVGMYTNFRANSPELIEDYRSDFLQLLQEPPIDTDMKVSKKVQDKGLVTTSPIGNDELKQTKPMLAPAVAAMVPFTSGTMIEDNGIDYGIQRHNGSPVIVNRFDRDTGYNMATIGDIGSGKSFSTKLQILRTLMRREDVEVVILDPLKGFEGLNAALGGEKIIVGGDEGLNPLEIKKTPQHVLDRTGQGADSIDPYSKKLDDVMSFFDTYFHIQGYDVGPERSILEDAVSRAYERKGITRKIETHSKESPTVKDVLSVLQEMADNPTKFMQTDTSEFEKDKIEDYASQLIVALSAFREGNQYQNLARHTEIDPASSRVTYLDLSQQEGSEEGMGLMMQLLFNAVYERAKRTDNKMMFIIDEARYMMRNSKNLKFLEQAVRHSRHYDLSIQFITQTVDEFYQHSEAEAIIDNCSMVQLCQLSDITEEESKNLGLNQNQMQFVRNAQAGDEDLDYSEALLKVGNEGWYPLRIRAADTEAAIVDYDNKHDDLEDLPGWGEDEDELEERIREVLDNRTEQEADEEHVEQRENANRQQRVKSFLVDENYSDLALDELGANRRQAYIGDAFDSEAGTDLAETEVDGTPDPAEMVGDTDSTHVYHVRIDTERDQVAENLEEATKSGANVIPVLSALQGDVEVLATDPTKLALQAGNFDEKFDALVGTTVELERFGKAVSKLATVDGIVVTDISTAVDWASDDLDFGTDIDTDNVAPSEDPEEQDDAAAESDGFESFD